MTKWDEILTLPVQNPPKLEFSSADIVWSRVEGWHDRVDRTALIPFARVDDFVRGESNMKECPTKFHVEARRRRQPKLTSKQKVDGILEYTLYWCSFGPDDHRRGGVVRPSRSSNAKRKTAAGRPSNKRGCICHFIVKRLIADPSIALVIYNFEKHVDKQGLPCHGPQDQMAAGTRAMFAPYISEELRLQVMSLLYVGVPVETIMQRHAESVEKQGGPSNRDDLLTHRYVRSLERKIRRSSYDIDPDESFSINLWVDANRSHVFYHKDFSDLETFTLGIQSEWQLQQMIQLCNHSILASDSKFGSNKLKYPIHSLLAFDSKNNAIPVAWIMAPRFSSDDVHDWLIALYNRVRSKDPTWKLGGFIIDDPCVDANAVREVFRCPVLLSFWRVRRTWHKNLIQKCQDHQSCVAIFKQLGKAVSLICREGGCVDIFKDILEDYVNCTDFVDYFKATWLPRLGVWCDALKVLPLAGVETSAAIECYHNQLKRRLMNENDPNVYQYADWLVHKLATKVHSYYWLDEFSEKDSFSRYWKDEWKSGLSSWIQASLISDSVVALHEEYAKVTSDDADGQEIIVWNPGSEFAICECNWSRIGNLCKHIIKTNEVFRSRGLISSSTSLHEYRRTLLRILSCPPNDSLMCDHAVSLLVSVQSQLDSLLKHQSKRSTSLIPLLSQQSEVISGCLPAFGSCNGGNLSSTNITSGELINGKEMNSNGSFYQIPHIGSETFLEGSIDKVKSDKKRARYELNASFVKETHDNDVIDLLEDEIFSCRSSEHKPISDILSHDITKVSSDQSFGSHPKNLKASLLLSVSSTPDHAGEHSLHLPDAVVKLNENNNKSGKCFNSITIDSTEKGSIGYTDRKRMFPVSVSTNVSVLVDDDGY